jgi:cbb3-type cytochrome oxidase subunit 3
MTAGAVVAVLLVLLLVAAMAWAWREADKAEAADRIEL